MSFLSRRYPTCLYKQMSYLSLAEDVLPVISSIMGKLFFIHNAVNTGVQCKVILVLWFYSRVWKEDGLESNFSWNTFEDRQLSSLVVASRPAVLKVSGSNPGWGAQEFSKLTIISINSAACWLHATWSKKVACTQCFGLRQGPDPAHPWMNKVRTTFPALSSYHHVCI